MRTGCVLSNQTSTWACRDQPIAVAQTRESRRSVFRQIVKQSYVDWPAYESTPLFDRRSLPALESDVRVVAEARFNQDEHEAIESFVHAVPLAYIRFDAHDRYASSTTYGMETLFRLFLLKECHGWDHETALVEYLSQYPDLCEQLDLEGVPDQSPLWRSWHRRFTSGLRDTVETAARNDLCRRVPVNSSAETIAADTHSQDLVVRKCMDVRRNTIRVRAGHGRG